MKESNWNDCLFKKTAKKVSPDIRRAKSLIETAKDRLDIIGEINEKNCNFVFEDYYTSILELIQAICFKNGYNISNHICLGFFIKDVLKNEEIYLIFDDLRYKINSLTYYGNKMDFETAKDAITKSKKIFEKIELLDK